MRLTQIRLAGFKSFADPTVIPTPSELVGVVGPNGCGKSNIIDAVRWVLGETRAAELRGASMQDVIFNGSGERKPAARASVELVFDNEQGRAGGQWSAFAEIAVRRVLTRDGASSYSINGQAVRRRDVHDIFLGTGLGSRGYAIIGQGMINRLIEARPDELRVYLEEAAGVSRYKERRREAENRLADTRDNLLRLDDIVRELAAQLSKLESQARVATAYRDLQAEAALKQDALWLLREQAARDSRQALAVETEKAQTDLAAAMARLRALEAGLEVHRTHHDEAGEAVHQAQARLYEVGAQVSRLEAEIRHVVEARQRLQARHGQLQGQIRDWSERQVRSEAALEAARTRLEEAQARAEALDEQALAAQAGVPALDAGLQSLAAQREEDRRALARTEQGVALLAQSQQDADRQWRALDDRRVRLQEELDTVEAPDADELKRLEGDSAALQAREAAAQQTVVELEARELQLQSQRTATQEHALSTRAAFDQLEARRQALVALQEKIQLEDALVPWLERQGLQGLGRLWQQLQVESGWETALEAVLQERMNAIGLRSLEPVQAFARDAPPARLAFYQAPAQEVVAAGVAPGVQRLLDFVRVHDTALQSLLANWLDGVLIAGSLDEALQHRSELAAGQLWVTARGDRIDAHTVRFHAPDSAQAGLLARAGQIAGLVREARAAQLIMEAAREAHGQAETAGRTLAADLQAARQGAAELTRLAHEAQLRHRDLEQRQLQVRERGQRLGRDLAELQRQQGDLAARRDEAQARFEHLDEVLATQQQALVDLDDRIAALSDQADRARARERECDRAAQEAAYAVRTVAHEIEDLERTLQLAGEQLRQASVQHDALQGELAALDEAAAQGGLQEALEARVAAEAALRGARLAQDAQAQALREADEARLTLERSLEPLRSGITALQLQEQEARLSVEQFAAQLDARQVDRVALRQHLEGQPPGWRQPGWLQSEVERLLQRVQSLGAVNLAALEELATGRERKGFLDAQREDLQAAIGTLEGAIRKIDRETRELLARTFEAVDRHFGELFPQLFGGGEARLIMTGDEILDAGVQVMAQPPGKRNTTIQLLSGGEKALTATALVFALFRLNPAPFCLLDEVDAPLDDANTERYAQLVKNMSTQTQFLFISHNKIAMRVARQLVGVTMQEQGVSRVVAVDMDAALQLAATEA